jgi:hypothetical protein
MGIALAVVLICAIKLVFAPRANLPGSAQERQASLSVRTPFPPEQSDRGDVITESPAKLHEPPKTGAAAENGITLIANSNTRRYHRADCAQLQHMANNHRVILASPTEAVAKNFDPCRMCKPPVAAH